jgi:PII interaction protein X
LAEEIYYTLNVSELRSQAIYPPNLDYEMNPENSETYINHPTWGLLYRICMVDENQDLFTTLYAQRLFFLVTTELKVLKFQPIGRTEARMMLENRLRTLRRSGTSQEYEQLQGVFQRTFQ